VSCAAPAETAFRYVADVAHVGSWTLGSWGATVVGDGLARGESLFDGSVVFIRPDPDERRLLVDFLVGADAAALAPRISVRVVPGGTLGAGADSCVVTMLAWRPSTMADERWARLCASHDVEIHLLRGRIEAL
jgi:hypothetical protein